MTGLIANILAEGGSDGLGALLWLVVVIAIGIISTVVRKVKESAERREQIRRGPAPKTDPRQENDDLPVNAREAMARAALKSMGIVSEPRTPPPTPTRKPTRREAPTPAPAQGSLGPPIESTVDDHVDEHILAGLQKKVATPASQAEVNVDLSSPEKLRQAIVLHEILAPPKGLRQQRELWDSA